MNLKWIKAIRSSGLTFIRQHTVRENLNVFESLHKWNDIVLGKYLIIPISYDSFSKITENIDSFKCFEDDVIAPFYFRLKGDWSWNLYICFVLKDGEFSKLTADKQSLVQRGKRFGKKIILSVSQMSNKLPIAKIPKRLNGATAANPLHDWQEKLAPKGLMFCLDNFRQQPFKEYLESDVRISTFISDNPRESENTLQRPDGHISTLHIGKDFRPHFLSNAPKLEFSQVNLVAGPNGMGKTSILECIELAYTGSIQRNLMVDRNAKENWNGKLIIDHQSEFTEVPTEAEKKIRETAYYKHKVGPRRNSQLNSAFHQYNYFSSDSVHHFLYNSNTQIDYHSAFARVIFGEQLERYEQCLMQYKEEFRKASRRFKEEYSDLNEELDRTVNEGISDNEIWQERVMAEYKYMMKWMKKVLPNYPLLNESVAMFDVEQWLHHIKPFLHELDVISTPFKNLQHEGLINGTQLVQDEQAIERKNTILQNELDLLREQLEKLPQTTDIEKNTKIHWDQFEDLHRKQTSLENLLQKLKENANILDHPESRERWQQIDKELTLLEKKQRQLIDVWNLYGYLTESNLPFVNQNDLRDQIDYWVKEQTKAKTKLEMIKEQISNYNKKVNNLNKILSELKSNALKYIQEQPTKTNCPVCDYNYETVELLKEAIDTSLSIDDGKLTNFLVEEDQITSQLNRSAIELERLSKVVLIQKRMEEAKEYLLKRKDIEEVKILTEGSDLQEIKDVLKSIYLRIEKQKSYQIELNKQLTILEQKGFTRSAIEEINRLLNNEILSVYLNLIKPNDTSIVLDKLITNDLEKLTTLVESARNKYVSVQENEKQIKLSRQILLQKLDELYAQEKLLIQRKEYLNELRRVWTHLKEKNVNIPQEYSWKEWRQYFEKLFLASNELGKALEPRILLEKKNREVAGLRKKIMELNIKLKRCNQALKVLSELRTLGQYGDDFVHSNFEAISNLFIALHSPNEFERLEWTEDGKIVALRKGTNRTCAIHQMSTGQRTSVILAIFFIMHLVMESAPQFLLLDEPVANMDELNVVGLLDFLRQLTITHGTQIFFTTANPQIATLFRRKFSMLGERFCAFHLRREVEGPVEIKAQQYLPFQENPILTPYTYKG